MDDTYQIGKSLRFNSADSAYLSRTASASNRKTWTWSGWVKRSSISTASNQSIFSATSASPSDNTNLFGIQFTTADTLSISGGASEVLGSSQVFKDTSVWNHIVVAFDTTQATLSDRIKMYVNGSQVTSFSSSSYVTQDFQSAINSAVQHNIGSLLPYLGRYFSGYIAEVNFVDGQALTPSSFGTRDINTYLWEPKAYTGTYGTNGFYLNFSDSSNTTATTLGKDQAGSNNWTPNNFSITAGPGNDSLVDSPTYYGTDTGVGGEARGDYCTLNPLNNSGVLSNGNLVFQASTTATQVALGTSKIIPSGKTYFEVNVVTAAGSGTFFQVGIAPGEKSLASAIGTVSGNGYAIEQEQANDIQLRLNGSTVVISTVMQTGDVLQVAVDHATGKLWFGRNNTWYDSSGGTTGNPSAGTNQSATISTVIDWFPAVAKYNTGGSYAINFGQRPFAYAAPSGFKALRGYNKLPVPTGGVARGNYATLSPLTPQGTGGYTLSDGGLRIAAGTTMAGASSFSTLGVSSGKWYAEFTYISAASPGATTGDVGIIANPSDFNYNSGNTNLGAYSRGYCYSLSGGLPYKFNNGSLVSYGASWSVNDVFGVALDLDERTLTFYKNGVSQGVAFTNLPSGYSWFFGCGGSSWVFYANFGQRPWAYDAPFGFLPLCTTSLPQPIVQKSSTAMDVVTYTGNGATSQDITGLSFSPDLVWLKSRTDAYDHRLKDTIRGNFALFSNLTNAESGYSLDFLSNGIRPTLGANDNINSKQYVAWAWDAGSSSVTNTSGSITSTVRANPQNGVSVVGYTGTGANATVGHGLGIAPKMIISKNKGATSNWAVYHASLPSAFNVAGTQVLYLNLTNANTQDFNAWNSNNTTSSVFSVGASTMTNNSGSSHIAYCFAEVEGFSKFGSYTGNGGTDGPFVYCGFRPRFIMVRRTDGDAWIIKDTARSAFNGFDVEIYPASSAVEGGPYSPPIMDYLANGFKLRSNTSASNASGFVYIYAAFAESPFKYSRAR